MANLADPTQSVCFWEAGKIIKLKQVGLDLDILSTAITGCRSSKVNVLSCLNNARVLGQTMGYTSQFMMSLLGP